MYLLAEWESWTGKYLAGGHSVQTEHSEVRVPCTCACVELTNGVCEVHERFRLKASDPVKARVIP